MSGGVGAWGTSIKLADRKHQPAIFATSNLAFPYAFAKKKGPVYVRPSFIFICGILSAAFT